MTKNLLSFMFIVTALFLSSTVNSYAQVEGIDISGSAPIMIKSSDDVYRSEDRTEGFPSTCERQIFTGYENVCSSAEPSTCTLTPVYNSESYPCEEYRTVTEQIYDHTVNYMIDVVKDASANGVDLTNCKLNVVVVQDNSENYYADCGTAIIRTKVLERTEVGPELNRERHVKVQLNFASVEGLSALNEGLKNVVYKKGIVSFITADLSVASNFVLNMSITRNRFILKDKVEFNRALKPSDYTIQKLDNGKVKVLVDLDKIGASFDSTKKHTIGVSLKTIKEVNLDDIINRDGFTNSLSSSVIVND